MRVNDFFKYASERYQIFLKKNSGAPKPWTKDVLLQKYRYCNVFREDDKVTKWFAQAWRNTIDVNVFGCIAFRWFNRIETGRILIDNGLFNWWDPRKVKQLLRNQKPIFGAAYIIRSPFGKKKLDGVVDDILTPLWKGFADVKGFSSLQEAHKEIQQFAYQGPFMAYEAVTDMANTSILSSAPDKMTWASPGPGAARGLARMLNKPLKTFHYGSEKSRQEMVVLMREILEVSREKKHWPLNWPVWDMRTCEHTLCEWDKYERVRLGEGTPKRRYPGQ